MTRVLIVMPVLSRPERVAPALASIKAATGEGETIDPLFVACRDDVAELAALEAAGAPFYAGPWLSGSDHQYGVKINWAFRERMVPDGYDWGLMAADDLEFHPGWLGAALRVHAETGKLVIGTNDLGNQTVVRGDHATHPLVHRDYVRQGTIDNRSKILHDSYSHNAVDVEFWQTALARGQAAVATDSHVEHLHPLWHREVKRDKTYQKGMRNAVLDRELLRRRERLWRGLQPRTGPLKLNLGCGPHVMRGFDNLDLPDWRFQTGLGFYADGSVAGASISHALMHLPEKDWPAFFAEVARVLEPRGVVRVTEDSTRDPASSRFGGFQRPATLTHPALVIRHMTDAGLDAREVGRDETSFRDGSLIQARHGAAPKVFFVEGVRP